MSGYLAVTMSATCRQAAVSASLPDHMYHLRVTGSAEAAVVDRATRPKPTADTASAETRAKRARPPVKSFLMAFLPFGLRFPAGLFARCSSARRWLDET